MAIVDYSQAQFSVAAPASAPNFPATPPVFQPSLQEYQSTDTVKMELGEIGSLPPNWAGLKVYMDVATDSSYSNIVASYQFPVQSGPSGQFWEVPLKAFPPGIYWVRCSWGF